MPHALAISAPPTGSILLIGASPEMCAAFTHASANSIAASFTVRIAHTLRDSLDLLSGSRFTAILLGIGERTPAFDTEAVKAIRAAADNQPILRLADTSLDTSDPGISDVAQEMVVMVNPKQPVALAQQVTAAIAAARDKLALEKAQRLIVTCRANHRQLAHDLKNAVGIIWMSLHLLKDVRDVSPNSNLLECTDSIERSVRTIAGIADSLATLGNDHTEA